jgi:hypothetical protein
MPASSNCPVFNIGFRRKSLAHHPEPTIPMLILFSLDQAGVEIRVPAAARPLALTKVLLFMDGGFALLHPPI